MGLWLMRMLEEGWLEEKFLVSSIKLDVLICMTREDDWFYIGYVIENPVMVEDIGLDIGVEKILIEK